MLQKNFLSKKKDIPCQIDTTLILFMLLKTINITISSWFVLAIVPNSKKKFKTSEN